MSNGNSFEEILSRLKNNLETDITNIEGTWTGDLLQSVANELARIYSMEIEPMYAKAFIITATGEDLDRCCADYGIQRNAATYAEGTVKLVGTPGTYEGLKATADDIVFNLPEKIVIPESGEVVVRCVCAVDGKLGNVPAGAINSVIPTTYRITKVTNEVETSEGYDTESDESLRTRTLEYINDPPTSGNIANYKEWALEVSGVESVQIYDLARGNGTVDVVIVADENTVATQQLLDTVYEYIESKRPIGADVQVIAATKIDVQVNANVKAKAGYTKDFIEDTLYVLLKNYLATLTGRNQLISYIKIADIIFSCEGVEDVTDYTVNGGKASISIEDRFFPVAVMPDIVLEE